jgi:DNA replication protein DnaD
MDLILSANYKATTLNVDFTVISLARGQFVTSQMKLAKKWGWHRETVSKFLRLLEGEKMTSIQTSKGTSTGYTLITIQNYGKYQSAEEDATDIETGFDETAKPTSERHPSGTNKKDKKEKNTLSSNLSHSNGLNGNSKLAHDDGFKMFWQTYPRRKNKGQAEKAWQKLNPSNDLLKIILEAITKARQLPDWTEKKYIPYPATWLKAKGWEDDMIDPVDGVGRPKQPRTHYEPLEY